MSLTSLLRIMPALVALAGWLPAVWAQDTPAGQKPADRRVYVERVWCQADAEWETRPAMVVCALVRAQAVRGQTLRAVLQLLGADGRRVRAVPGTPMPFADEQGLYRVVLQDKVLHDQATWNPLRFFIPQGVLDLPAGRDHKLIARVTISCGGLANSMDAEITIPPRAEAAAGRSIRIVNIGRQFNILPPPLDVGGMGYDQHHPPPPPRSALGVTAHVEADGLRGQRLISQVWLLRGEQWVMAAPGTPNAQIGAQGRFTSEQVQQVADDQARWPAIRHEIPYEALDLTPGQEHRLRLVFFATCGGLRAMWSDELILRLGSSGQLQPLLLLSESTETESVEPFINLPEAEAVQPRDEGERQALARAKAQHAAGRIDINVELLSAAAQGQAAVVRFLLDNGADVRARGVAGRTPLHLAAAGGHREAAEILITARPPSPRPDKAEDRSSHPEEKGDSGSLFGRDIDDEYLRSLSFDDFLETVQRNVGATDDRGLTPLHLAALGGHYGVADLLLGHGAEVNATGKDGMTPLHVAVMAGDDAIVALLLLKGADPSARQDPGVTPLDLARSETIARRLKEAAARSAADPENQRVRRTVEGFLDAVRQGGRERVGRWLTPEQLQRWPASVPPVKLEYKIKRVDVQDNSASVVVWLKLPDVKVPRKEFQMTAKLKRSSQGWLIADTSMEPFWKELDWREEP